MTYHFEEQHPLILRYSWLNGCGWSAVPCSHPFTRPYLSALIGTDKLCAMSKLCRPKTLVHATFEGHWPSCALGAPIKTPDLSVPACDTPSWSVPPCDVPGWYMPPVRSLSYPCPPVAPLAIVCAHLQRPWLVYAVRPLAGLCPHDTPQDGTTAILKSQAGLCPQ